MFKRELILQLLITLTTICAYEILRILVEGSLFFSVSFGAISLAMLLAFNTFSKEKNQ